ncbi:MAG TPA: hypothetical protein P5333_23675 [Caldilinea sp.]|nr:hypothetical protein [Caldilinea sp.]
MAGGAGLLAGQAWWRGLTVAAALFSTVVYLLLWDGSSHNLDGQGWIGILINGAILAVILLFHWPTV